MIFRPNNDGTCSVIGNKNSVDTELHIPQTSPNGDTVTSIGNSAFFGCTSLTSIEIPSSVTSIGSHAFSGCTSLKSKKANYKAFKLIDGKLICRGLEYHEGEKTSVEGELELCGNGIHYCTNLFEIFEYYFGELDKKIAIYECEVSEENISEEGTSKRCARWIIPQKRLYQKDIIKILNGGSTFDFS